ncbi:stimulator of interferon genes protein-like [Saccostrea echinata]|uniref:stimulator of interferon genes protein-like n=1 Tax=Saccostrea echinata TaxID=191078 RepID=UPI002A81F2EB|nr:stimulator of interferon genes protein-like [Saccostrea echinata]
MSSPTLEHPHRYHAFISYCPDTDTNNAKKILEAIENEGFQCCFPERDFLPGGALIDLVVDAIHSSRHVILVISPSSLQSEWSKFEMLLAVDDSHTRNRVCLVPVLLGGVKLGCLPPPLRLLTCVELREKFENVYDIIQAIKKADYTWESLLPVGNLAHGFAWGYYFGYLKIILPTIDVRAKEWWMDNGKNGKMSEKLFLLFPQSCRCRDSLSDENPLIEHVGHLPVITKNRAGTVARQYRNSIYSIQDDRGEEYYFVGEYVTVIHTMYEMEQNAKTGLQTKEKYIQAMRFYLTIKDILEKDPECSKRYRIIFYKDKSDSSEKIPRLICREIKRQIQEESADDRLSETSFSSLEQFSSICGPDFNLYSIVNSVNSHMSKSEPYIHRDEKGKLKTVERGDQLTNVFNEPT